MENVVNVVPDEGQDQNSQSSDTSLIPPVQTGVIKESYYEWFKKKVENIGSSMAETMDDHTILSI